MTVGFAEVGARTNFTLLNGASHPAEIVASAALLGHAGIGVCDANSLAGVVRAHVAAEEVGIPFIVGCRLILDDDSCYLVWPTDRDNYGRLTRLLSLARMRAPKGRCQITRAEMVDHAEGWSMAAVAPAFPDAGFAARLAVDAAELRDRLALPLLCTAPVIYDGADRQRLDTLQRMAFAAGVGLLATTDPRYHHPERRRLADVLTAIRLGVPMDRIGFAADRNGERCLKSAQEMGRLFSGYPAALENTLRVLDAGSGFSLDQLSRDWRVQMARRQYSREFTLDTVRLVKELGVSVVQASRDLDVGENILRRWIKELTTVPLVVLRQEPATVSAE